MTRGGPRGAWGPWERTGPTGRIGALGTRGAQEPRRGPWGARGPGAASRPWGARGPGVVRESWAPEPVAPTRGPPPRVGISQREKVVCLGPGSLWGSRLSLSVGAGSPAGRRTPTSGHEVSFEARVDPRGAGRLPAAGPPRGRGAPGTVLRAAGPPRRRAAGGAVASAGGRRGPASCHGRRA